MSKKEKGQAQQCNAIEGDSIQVYVRVRPSESHDVDTDFGKCLEVRLPDTIIMHSKPEPKVFTYDHVTEANTTQESVFTAVGKRIIESCVGGYNGTIFAYGQTGSGKTFTMLGPCEDGDNFHHELRGVIPRSFEYLFSLVNREREKHGDRFEFLCRCTFLEIYNEQIYDLLDPASMGLHLRENMKKGVFVDGLIERAVASPSEAYGVLTAGWHNRRVAATSMNRESSRSHAVFTVSIESKEKKAGVSNIRVSQLHLVDLAGSERQSNTKTSGARLKEAGSINKSLSILGNVIMALVDIAHGKQRHVPYRDSKLSFLLRDSLGGNAKTYIIANVHPDAKCFGETLSTLKFARRAKMIKNRAVVNEDTQGNVMHLQAEIRRLREALAIKGADGSIPRGPSENGDSSSMESNGSVSGQQASGSSSKWKKYFLEAMSLRDGVEIEKRELREKVTSLEELCSKRDQVISSNKMIIKFRNSTIDMLQKTKSKATSKEDRDALNENLKKEIEQLHEQLEHNPFVMRYVVENQSLRAQNRKLKAMEGVQSGEAMAAAKAQELEKLFLELREGLSNNRRFSTTPNSTPVDGENVATSTLVILKSQIKKLQNEQENAKQEHAEQEEMTRKNRLELESELAAYKKANSELEKTLQGMKVKNKLDRDAMNDIHMQTIKQITTPKKVSYHLRSRMVLRGETPGGPGGPGLSDNGSPLRSHSANSLASGDMPMMMTHSPAFAEEGIIDEEMPEHIVEQCNEALTVELQKLQDKYANLHQQLEEHESQKHKMMQNTSKLEHQLQQITELHSTESKVWQEQEKDLTTRLAEATSRVSVLQRDYEITKSEAEDFRVMLEAADKQIGQEKKQKSEVTQNWDKTRAALGAQVVRLENELCNRSREVENLTEDREQFQDAYNTLQEEHEFQQQREKDLEHRLKGKKAEIIQLQEEIQKHLEKLDGECDKNKRLTAELRQGDNTKQDLLAAQELIDQFREQRDDLLQRLNTETLKLGASKEELETVNTALTVLRKTDIEQKEALSSLMSALQDQKTTVKEREEQLATLQIQLEDTRGQVSLLEVALDDGKASAEGLESQVAALEDRLHLQAREHQEQIECMRADAMDATQQQKELLKELEKQSEELNQLHKQMKEKEEEFERKETELKSSVESLEQQLEEVKTNLSTVVVELDEPEAKRRRTADCQALEMESLRESEKRFKELSNEYDNMRDQMNEEIRSLKTKADELEDLRISKEILQAQYRALTYEIEEVRNEMVEKESSLKDEVHCLKRDMEHQKTILASMLRDKQEALDKLSSVQISLEQAKANGEILQESMDQVMEELERTSALESAHFKEKEDIKSKLEEEREEKSKLMKEVAKWKEANEEAELRNTELSGHQNHKQKIRHLQSVKAEKHLLQEDVGSLQKQLNKAQLDNERMKREYEVLQKKLSQLISGAEGGAAGGVVRGQVPKMPSTLKENNSDPDASSDMMCTESAYSIGTKALFGNLMP